MSKWERGERGRRCVVEAMRGEQRTRGDGDLEERMGKLRRRGRKTGTTTL